MMHRDPHQCERTIQFSRTERKLPSDWGAKNLEDDPRPVKQNSNIFPRGVTSCAERCVHTNAMQLGRNGGPKGPRERPIERQKRAEKGFSAQSSPQPFHANAPTKLGGFEWATTARGARSTS